MAENSFAIKICNQAMRYSVFVLISLIPLFFLPFTSDVLDFNKQTLALFLSFIGLFAWMIRAMISGKLEINLSKMHIFAGLLFLSYLLSTIFSINRYGSFWGSSQSGANFFISFLSLFIVYFLISNAFSRKDIFSSAVILLASVAVSQIIGIFQLFGLFIIPFSFAKTVSFNTLGGVGTLGFLSSILLPIIIILFIFSKKWLKFFLGFQLFLSILLFCMLNYPSVWWTTIAGSALIMIFMALKRNMFDVRWISLPVFFLAVSLFFVLLNPQMGIARQTSEVFLSQGTTLNIALKSLKENPILGSGLGTFGYNFSKFKNVEFNKSSLWNFTFNKGASEFLSGLATTGAIGALIFLAFMIFVIFRSVKFFVFEKLTKTSIETEDENYLNRALVMGFGISFIVECIVYFLYNTNTVLGFVFFFLASGLAYLTAKEIKTHELNQSSLLTLVVTFIFTLAFIFGLGILILDGQRYIAEIKYYNSLVAFNKDDLEGGIKNLESAASLNPSSDLYFRQLSQAYLLSLQKKTENLSADELTDEQKSEIQTLLANSINAGNIATDLNRKSAVNWSSRGYVYQNLFGFLTDADTWAINSYEEALKLDPNSPYLYAQEGYVNLISASRLGQDNASKKAELLSVAKEKLEKSIELNPVYSDAFYYLGLVYDSMGDKAKAIEQFEKIKELNPNNKDIQKMIDDLKAGKTTTESFTEQNPPEDNTPENSLKNPPEETEETESK